MGVGTLLLMGGLGLLAWLLAGGWPYVRDRYVPDDGPVGLGAGITALCPCCGGANAGANAGAGADVGARPGRDLAALLAVDRMAPTPVGTGSALAARSSMRPLAVGRDEVRRLECPSCGTTFQVLGVPSAVLPAPRTPAG